MGRIKNILALPFKFLRAPVAALRRELDRLIIDQGARRFRLEVQQAITAMILASVGRWIYFILVILTAHVMGRAMEADISLWVAFGILAGIYGYYVLVGMRAIRFCCGIWRRNGFIWNPVYLSYLYVYDMVVSEITKNKFTRYSTYLFFPFSRRQHTDDLAKDIIRQGIADNNLWICVAVRLILYATGWTIYLLCYENIFLYATGIDFDSWYEPLIWPFMVVFYYFIHKPL